MARAPLLVPLFYRRVGGGDLVVVDEREQRIVRSQMGELGIRHLGARTKLGEKLFPVQSVAIPPAGACGFLCPSTPWATRAAFRFACQSTAERRWSIA